MRDENDVTASEPGAGNAAQQEGAIVAVEHDPGGVTVRVAGELDVAGVPQLRRVLDQLDKNPPNGRLVLDLTEVEFMDSTGLAALAHAQHDAERNGYPLTLRLGSPQVVRLLEIAGMTERFALE